ncbi:MAG: winged helix-turn-helix transcriptional regulator [Thermoplasmatota archaeon]
MAGGSALRLAIVVLALLAFAPVVAAESQTVNVDSNQVAHTDAARVIANVGVQDGTVSANPSQCNQIDGTTAYLSQCEKSVQYTAPDASVHYQAQVNLPLSLLNEKSTAATPSGSPISTSSAVVAMAPTSPAVIATAATAVLSLAAVVYLGQKFGRLAVLGLLPLYTHIQDGDLLKEPNRARVFDLIKSEPGISTKDIADRLDLAWGTVTHHLAKLEKRQFVVSKKYGKYRRYFANGAAADAAKKDLLAVLKVPATAEVAHAIRDSPGLSQKEVSVALGVSSSTILWHVKRLERVSLVNRVRDGKAIRYYPAPSLANDWAPVRDIAGHA